MRSAFLSSILDRRAASGRAGLLAAAAVLAACGSARAESSGESLFVQNCSACHQVTGLGIPGAFPALSGDKFVAGPAETVATTVLNGRGGMPAFGGELSNEDLAAILTYVRSAWSNHAPPITAATIAKVRTSPVVDQPASVQAH